MTKRILILLSALLVVALVLLAREVSRTPDNAREMTAARPTHASMRIVLAAGVEQPPDDLGALEGMPDVPAPTVPTLVTMPTSAPAHAETITAPKL